MIQRLIELSLKNRGLVVLAYLVLAAWGYWALLRTPIDAIPDLSENQVIVFTDWMGRSPQEIEDQVTYPLSVSLQGLAGVKVVRSSSEFNFSMITIIFDEATDYYFARTRVLERLSIASTFLPPGVTPYLAPDATAELSLDDLGFEVDKLSESSTSLEALSVTDHPSDAPTMIAGLDDKSRAESSTPDRRLRSAGSTRVGRAALLRLTTPP